MDELPGAPFDAAISRSFASLVEPRLSPGESLQDVLAGCFALASKRASLKRRPVLPVDAEFALSLWCWHPWEQKISPPPRWLLERRREIFEGAVHDSARVVGATPERALALSYDELQFALHRGDFKVLGHDVPGGSDAGGLPVAVGGDRPALALVAPVDKVKRERGRPSWRERALARIGELRSQLNRLEKADGGLGSEDLAAAREHLLDAERAAKSRPSLKAGWYGSDVDRVFSNLHKAEVDVLRLTPSDCLTWQGPVVLAAVRQHLGLQDPRREVFERQLTGTEGKLLVEFREAAVVAMQAAHGAEEIERAKVRSFRNCVLLAVIGMFVIALALAVWGAISPSTLAMCFDDPRTGPACPVGSEPKREDVAIVEMVGLAGAALVGTLALRHIQGTTLPYSVPGTLLLLKLPAGAVCAVVGLLLIRGNIVPGLSDLDNTGQIIAWAVLLGVSQEIFTRMVDQRGQAVLENVRTASKAFVDERGAAISTAQS
ncbi:hypothetical protein ACIBBD_35915 [Streptomyces sp. NPDC051315]|uniref:hypothetical protein n=1 Tax=Streptomyces sp. NPDC051315 TaxID=3365650 RepID=UPI0037A83EF6